VGRPIELRNLATGPADYAAHRFKDCPAVGMLLVDSFGVTVEFVATKFQPTVDRDPLALLHPAVVLPSVVELVEEVAPIGAVRMELKAAVPQTMLAKPAIDHVEGRRFFGHEQ